MVYRARADFVEAPETVATVVKHGSMPADPAARDSVLRAPTRVGVTIGGGRTLDMSRARIGAVGDTSASNTRNLRPFDCGASPLEPFCPEAGLASAQIALARLNVPDRPWGHLLTFPALEEAVCTVGDRLLDRAQGRQAMLSLKFGSDRDCVPDWIQCFAEPRNSVALIDDDAAVFAAACGAAALSWQAMTGLMPSSMTGWLALDPGMQTGRDLHFDAGPGSVVITMAGMATWCVEPSSGRALAARKGKTFAVPGRSSRTLGGLLHAVVASSGRAVAVFRSSASGEAKGRPSARYGPLEFNRERCALLLGRDQRPERHPEPGQRDLRVVRRTRQRSASA